MELKRSWRSTVVLSAGVGRRLPPGWRRISPISRGPGEGQGPGQLDPLRFRQMMSEQMKKALGASDDEGRCSRNRAIGGSPTAAGFLREGFFRLRRPRPGGPAAHDNNGPSTAPQTAGPTLPPIMDETNPGGRRAQGGPPPAVPSVDRLHRAQRGGGMPYIHAARQGAQATTDVAAKLRRFAAGPGRIEGESRQGATGVLELVSQRRKRCSSTWAFSNKPVDDRPFSRFVFQPFHFF